MIPRQKSGNIWACWFLVIPVFAALFCWQGCKGDEDSTEGAIRVLEPRQGQTVQTHSVHFAVSLDADLDPAGLKVLLNGRDMSSHLRKKGSQAEGYVHGMVPGNNILSFSAPGFQGGNQASEVRFTFAPVPVDAIEASKEFSLTGLDGIVDVLVDPWGVHHIYTMENNPDDMAYIQGYLVAKHRLFQIDFFRKVAQGRLTELLGTFLDRGVLETDLFIRTLFLTYERGRIENIYDVLVEELEAGNPELYALLSRFVEGINAYIEDLEQGRHGATWPQQYKLINLVLPPYEIEPITEAQILAIGRLQSLNLTSTFGYEIDRKISWEAVRNTEALGVIPNGTLQDIFRAEPPDHATILKAGEPHYVGPAPTKGTLLSGKDAAGRNPDLVEKNRLQHLKEVLKRIERVRKMVWGNGARPLSNNWVLGPSMTASGFPILSNDPHLSLSNPSIFYPIHGDNKSFSNGPLNVSGVTFPGLPGLMLGQNERIAWGATVSLVDVNDVYEEVVTVDGDSKWVTFNGNPVAVEATLERFRIRGGDSELGEYADIPIDYVPHHGPQLPGDPFSQDPGLTVEHNLTVRWTGQFVTQELEATSGLMEAGEMDDFFSALENFGVGSQNFIGADVNGEIAYFPHALIPRRMDAALTPEHPPYMPLPGTGEYEWMEDAGGRPRFLTPEEIPQSRNPDRGWLATSNNDINGGTLDNDVLNDDIYLAYWFVVGFRNSRVSELLLESKKEERDLERMKRIQGDHVSIMARRLLPFCLQAMSDQEVLNPYPQEVQDRLEQAGDILENWDLRCKTGVPDPFTGEEPTQDDVNSSVASSIFFVWLNRLTPAVFDDELAGAGTSMSQEDRIRALFHILDDVQETPGSPYYVHTLGPDGQSLLWDNVNTVDREETWKEIMVQAMDQALKDLDALMKSNQMDTWRWGKIHTLTYELAGLGGVVLAYNLPSYSILEQILGVDTKGYPRAGGWVTVDPGFHSLEGLDYSSVHGPAMRMVVELEEGIMRAYNVIPGGVNDLQSLANPFRPVKVNSKQHYGDQIPLWLANEYRPQYIFWEDVTNVAESRIRFEPR